MNEIERLSALQTNWQNQLIGKNSKMADTMTALRIAPEWQGVLGFNEFALRTEAVGAPPWAGNDWTPAPWGDVDDTYVASWMQRHGINTAPSEAGKAVEAVARDNTFHPVRDYLGILDWDGVARIGTFTSTYFGSEDTQYTRAVGRNFLISAVARIYQPGCKVDHMLVLEGPQGTLKSTALRILAEPWFTDEIADLGSKDAAMQMQGAWIIEASELEGMSRAEITKIKAFLSRQTDRFRPAYGHRVIESPRTCALVGTTNGTEYLRDETGGRRFWPIKCGKVDIEVLKGDRDQIWAEARGQYQDGAKWWLDTAELAARAAIEQDKRYNADAWEEPIHDYLATKTDTSVGEILLSALFIERGNWKNSDQQRVGAIMSRCEGWEKYQKRDGTSRSRRYRKRPEGVTA